jgi:uncharacterized protein (TIGR02996 family)
MRAEGENFCGRHRDRSAETRVDDEAGFLRAIADDPEDDAPRLVYADWLDERDDPRGEFIRVQLEFERTAPLAERYAVLRARARALRRLVDPEWAVAMGFPPRHRPLFAALPTARADRWALVDEFIEIWHPPLGPGDGYSEDDLRAAEVRLGCRLPAALREWYALAGRRRDVWSLQDRLEAPERLRVEPGSGDLVFRWENQGCERWGIRAADLGRDDPPVVELDAGVAASPTVSAFACLVLVYEAMSAPGALWAGGEVPEGELQAMAARGLSPCDLPDRYWVVSPIRVFEGTDLIVQLHGDNWVHVAARGEAAYERIDGEVRRWLEVY